MKYNVKRQRCKGIHQVSHFHERNRYPTYPTQLQISKYHSLTWSQRRRTGTLEASGEKARNLCDTEAEGQSTTIIYDGE